MMSQEFLIKGMRTNFLSPVLPSPIILLKHNMEILLYLPASRTMSQINFYYV